MAATMHAKINRRKLDKLNIIKICEEILNPSVPMALRLSGILMGGVVIVYERKVKLLYDDVTRLLVEINEAWKVKAATDPTLLPKGKSQAKYEAVTLPVNREEELGEIEQSRGFSTETTMMGFQQTAYFAMLYGYKFILQPLCGVQRLDNVDEPCVDNNNNHREEEDPPQNYHQVDAANITLFERFDPYQADTDTYSRFERFDIEGDEETQLNFSQQQDAEIPSTLIPSPPPPEEPQKPDEIHDQHPEDQFNQQSDEVKDLQENQQRQGPSRKRARKPASFVMDYEQTIIPGHIYQSWLQNASDMVSRRGRKRRCLNSMSTMKIANLMELPPVVLICGLFDTGNREIYYPAPLLELWMRSTQPPHDSPPGTISPPQPPEPSSSSPPERVHYQDPLEFPFEEIHSGVGSQSLGVSVEKQRTVINDNDIPSEIFVGELRTNPMNNGMVTPGNSGDEVRSIPSSGSGHGFLSNNSEVNSGRSNKKRPFSSSRHSGSGLEPVAEEYPWQQTDPNFKLARLSENGLAPENDLLVETGPTQTQHPIINQPTDHITETIRMQLKTHFDTPGSAQIESLNQLALGMNRKRAAHLFYQTCVLASRDFVKVEQRVPYGDILISRGAKM
ncbi:sister chromatid cohesion 1 protein 1 [Cornus florida]|uniref:sister chromatid cohesion 1 protein 1 n=1 Tax=Cornus florida TaxID=4283 RepID=UPI002897F2AB|nr:sister chromatid cohesion 1 protein 1 [Cornus florida]